MNKTGGTYCNPYNKKEDSNIREIKTVKMNYKVNEPTVNDRIYKKEDLKNALDKALKQHEVPVVRNSSELYKINQKTGIYSPQVLFKDIIGFFKGYEIKDNGEIYLEIKPIINTELFDGCHHLSTNIMGMIRKDKSVEIEAIVGFFIAGNKDIIDTEKGILI